MNILLTITLIFTVSFALYGCDRSIYRCDHQDVINELRSKVYDRLSIEIATYLLQRNQIFERAYQQKLMTYCFMHSSQKNHDLVGLGQCVESKPLVKLQEKLLFNQVIMVDKGENLNLNFADPSFVYLRALRENNQFRVKLNYEPIAYKIDEYLEQQQELVTKKNQLRAQRNAYQNNNEAKFIQYDDMEQNIFDVKRQIRLFLSQEIQLIPSTVEAIKPRQESESGNIRQCSVEMKLPDHSTALLYFNSNTNVTAQGRSSRVHRVITFDRLQIGSQQYKGSEIIVEMLSALAKPNTQMH